MASIVGVCSHRCWAQMEPDDLEANGAEGSRRKWRRGGCVLTLEMVQLCETMRCTKPFQQPVNIQLTRSKTIGRTSVQACRTPDVERLLRLKTVPVLAWQSINSERAGCASRTSASGTSERDARRRHIRANRSLKCMKWGANGGRRDEATHTRVWTVQDETHSGVEEDETKRTKAPST